MIQSTTSNILDTDQKKILIVYSLYTNQTKHSYLQYTAACAVIFYLNKKGIFTYNPNELLVYDYGNSRKYIWEAKKFMNDINVLRDQDLLIRARSKSKTSRDVNAHQCSTKGQAYVKNNLFSKPYFALIKDALSCGNDGLYAIQLEKTSPMLINKFNSKKNIEIDGFLRNLQKTESINYKPFHL